MDENSLDFTIIHVLDKLLPQMYSWQEFSVNTIINISDEALRKLFPQDMSTTAVTNFFAFTSGGRNDTREHLISSLENYLIHNQFAVIASEKDGKKLILTEKGKKAQELNSFTNYFLWEQQEKKKQK